MARTTRSAKAAPSEKAESTDSTSQPKYSLPEESKYPPKLFILPNQLTKDALIVSLPNPRYSKPTRYLACPETGIYEFTTISAPTTTPRSWLVESKAGQLKEGQADNTSNQFQAHITNGADLFVATPIDPVFLLLPGLFGPTNTKSDAKRLFLSSDDHFDALTGTPSDLSEVLRCAKSRALLEARMEAVSDAVDAGDEKMFRLSEKKLVQLILSKAKVMSLGSLPRSMEEKFVTKALEAPLLTQQSAAVVVELKQVVETVVPTTGSSTPNTESAESQSSVSTVESTATTVTEASTTATSVDGESAGDGVVAAMRASSEVTSLQRLRVAFNFICASYVPPSVTNRLQELLKDPKAAGIDFAPLESYLEELAKARAEAAASRSMTDYSRKRALDDEEEEVRAEKRRKAEEEKKRKANESRGVKNLRKVNTTGMKKMSDFFKKK